MKNHKKIKLVQTCAACPEQYDAFFNGVEVGYLRLRHGYFCAEHNSEVVYYSTTKGDGIFDDDERKKHLKKARKAIYKSIMNEK